MDSNDTAENRDKKSSYTGFTEARKEANKRYMSKFIEVKVRMSPEKRDIIKAHSEKRDSGSATAFINRAIDETMERDKKKK